MNGKLVYNVIRNEFTVKDGKMNGTSMDGRCWYMQGQV